MEVINGSFSEKFKSLHEIYCILLTTVIVKFFLRKKQLYTIKFAMAFGSGA